MIMIIAILLLILVLYLAIREHLPIVVYTAAGGMVRRAKNTVGLYELRVAVKTPVPSWQWRAIQTNTTIAPFGTFMFRGRLVSLFGTVGCRVYPVPEIKMKGAEVMPCVFNEIPHKPIEVIVTNLNPKFPYIAREGELIAYIEFFRVPSYHLVHIVKEENNDTLG